MDDREHDWQTLRDGLMKVQPPESSQASEKPCSRDEDAEKEQDSNS
jgi:hypothetical protein